MKCAITLQIRTIQDFEKLSVLSSEEMSIRMSILMVIQITTGCGKIKDPTTKTAIYLKRRKNFQ